MPAGHSWQVERSALGSVPGAHSWQVVAPAREAVPLGQALQAVAPSSSVNVPAGHSWELALGPPWQVLPVKHGSQAVYLNTGTNGLLVFCGWGGGNGGRCDMTSPIQRPTPLSEAPRAPPSCRCF